MSNLAQTTLPVRPWLAFLLVIGIALIDSPMISVIFLGFVSFLALKEYFSMIPTRRADRRVLFWAYLSIPFQYYFAAIGWYGMFVIFIPVYMFLLIPFRMILQGETKHFLQAIGSIQWGLMTTVYCLSYVSFLMGMKFETTVLPAGNQGLLLFLTALTQVNLIYSACFKSKTGIILGIISTMIVACLLSSFLTPFNLFHAALIGMLISVAGFIGETSIAAVKHDMGVTHTGILEKINSLTFTAPLYFHFINYFY